MTLGFKKRGNKGQATIELALALPFMVWLIYYLVNAYYTMHTYHIGQKYSQMNLYQRINLRAKFIVDDVVGQAHQREFMAVQYRDLGGELPRRKIIKGPVIVTTTAGICREPGCQ